MLDDQFRIWMVLKCLSLRVGVLSFKPPQVTILLDLKSPSLNIFINNPRLLHTFNAILQAVFLDGLQKHLN
jgi:hypothetical protein